MYGQYLAHPQAGDADPAQGSGQVATDVVARAVPASPRTVRGYTKMAESKAKARGECVDPEWPGPMDNPPAGGGAAEARPGSRERPRPGGYLRRSP